MIIVLANIHARREELRQSRRSFAALITGAQQTQKLALTPALRQHRIYFHRQIHLTEGTNRGVRLILSEQQFIKGWQEAAESRLQRLDAVGH